MAWRAAFRGFPYTLYRRPMSGRRGADDAAGGLCAAAPQGRNVLVCALPLAGDAEKMAYGGAASVGAKRPLHGGPGARMALRHCDAIAGFLYVFSSQSWLVSGTP